MPDTMPPLGRVPLPAADSVHAAALARRIADRTARVAIIGLGHVGLPLALAICGAGFRTLGCDTDGEKLARLAAGESPLRHIPSEALWPHLRSGRFALAGQRSSLNEADAILICVPTPLGRHREPDLSHVEDAARRIAGQLRPGQLIVLESTTYPGTTREVLLPILESTGLRCGREFFLAYSPEREDPGNAEFHTAGIPKVVGGADAASLRLALALYGAVVRRTVPVGSLETAEAVKLTENVFRAVNIGLVNELKLVFGAMGIDIWEVIEAARTKPFGYMPFWPGPGLGGHCIPVDPFYLTWKARAHGVSTRFVELAGEINTAMPHHVLDRLAQALDRMQQRGLSGSRILVLGLGYKRNLDDLRESPALRLMELLEERGAEADYFDPLVPRIPRLAEHPGLGGRRSLAWSAEALHEYHAALIVTDHDAVDYAMLARESRLVVDTRNICGRLGLTGPHIIKA